jgi:hypothetical protein
VSDITGKVRFFCGNLKATYDFAKKAAKVADEKLFFRHRTFLKKRDLTIHRLRSRLPEPLAPKQLPRTSRSEHRKQ